MRPMCIRQARLEPLASSGSGHAGNPVSGNPVSVEIRCQFIIRAVEIRCQFIILGNPEIQLKSGVCGNPVS